MKLLEAALHYQKLGFSVIPMRDKQPLIKFADKPPLTEEEIRTLWGKYPNANIAVKTDKFFVIDIDRHEGGADGFKSIALYDHPEYFKNTMFQTTPNGGEQHFYFKRNGLPKNQHIDWIPGVDVKAHPNNYVMVPPSVTKNGQYKWALVEKNGEVLTETDIVTATDGLIQAVLINKSFTDGYKKPSFKPKYGAKNRTAELFEVIAEGFGAANTGRNDKLAKTVGALLLRGVEVDRIRELVFRANQNSIDPLPQKEVEATTESIINKHYREKGGAND